MRVHRHAPFQIPGDAAVLKTLVKPFKRNGCDKVWPFRFLALYPAPESCLEGGLLQEQMLRIADLDIR